MINRHYNKDRHRELLDYQEMSRKKGKSLKKEFKEKNSELTDYIIIVYCHLNWEMKDEFLELFKEFLEKNISSFQFCGTLEKKLKLNENLSDDTLLSDNFCTIDPKADRFTDFIDDLLLTCEICDRNPEPLRLRGYIGEMELREQIRETFFELQKFLEE
jgi:hypothetical protein